MDRFEQIIAIRRALRDIKFSNNIPVAKGNKPVPVQEAENIKKNGDPEAFVIPDPSEGEDEQTFISRCISDIIDEYGQEQASAICYGQWEK
jgi:hypothetical protein